MVHGTWSMDDMGYKQYYVDPADDNHLQGALWLGKARDPSLVYR